MKRFLGSRAWVAASVAGWVAGAAASAAPINYQMVTVGDAGNAADTTGYGAVGYAYGIGKYEFTNTQYTQFLNAVDPEGTNPYGIWNGFMGTDARGGIGFSGVNSNGSKYFVRPEMGPKPVNFVNCWGAARVANWLQAGGTSYGTTAAGAAAIDGGAYTLNGQTSGSVPSKNATAVYWIPLENEWYKAAFYKGGGTSAGYWLFATQSDAVPYAVSATSHGVGTSDGINPVTSGNYANWARYAAWNGLGWNVTDVGTNGGGSAYGTFDMSGNVWEWNSFNDAPSYGRGLRAGAYYDNTWDYLSSKMGLGYDAAALESGIGFRLAGLAPAAVPEIDPAGMGSVLALVGGALGLLERRRVKAA